MSVMKRIGAHVGMSAQSGTKQAASGGLICPHCHRQTSLVPCGGLQVCQFCGKAPERS